MTSALEERILRDSRFASDVSHELRSPLMTLTGSVAVLERRREGMPEQAQLALDLLSADVRRFKVLVEDLLEISRLCADSRFWSKTCSKSADSMSVPCSSKSKKSR